MALMIVILWVTACSPALRGYKKLDAAHKTLADSLLLYALDHEALYTLLDTLKPISSVKMLRFPLAADSTHVAATVPALRNPAYLDTLAMYERVCRALSTSKNQWLLVPFSKPDKGYRNIQIYVVRQQSFEKKIAEYPAFFSQFGISRLSHPAMVITHVENTDTYDRWRGYGYLFGYPGYAVDFFVEAGNQQKETGKFVERQFFHIPVFVAKEGYFTYALPKNVFPAIIDSTIYGNGVKTLEKYKGLRKKWVQSDKIKTNSWIKYLSK
jgi:hypothetical protein